MVNVKEEKRVSGFKQVVYSILGCFVGGLILILGNYLKLNWISYIGTFIAMYFFVRGLYWNSWGFFNNLKNIFFKIKNKVNSK